MSEVVITGLLVLPDDLPRDNINAGVFGIQIIWRGTYERRGDTEMGDVDWYSVENNGSSLSRAGKWSWQIQPFQRWQYRFIYDEAIEKALAVVNQVSINGRTWAEWESARAVDK